MKRSRMLLVLGLAPVLAVGAFCQTYVSINVVLPPLNPTRETYPTSINDQGVIAGYYTDAIADAHHGFVSEPGCTPIPPVLVCFTSFDAPAPNFPVGTFASSINHAGAITGYFVTPTSPTLPPTNHGYIRDPFGNFTTFDPPGSISTVARSINAGGDVTGDYQDLNNVSHGFVRHDVMGKLISFDPAGSVQTTAVGINQKGEITGSYLDADHRAHGFLRRSGGAIESFDPPQSAGTMATGINDAGEITGIYTLNGRGWGFLRRADGKIVSFDTPGSLGIFTLLGSLLTSGLSINDEGAITGSYTDSAGIHGFIRVPEGMITSFDPPSNMTGCLPNPVFPSVGTTSVTSINQGGVIIGWCTTGQDFNFYAGWERLP